MGAAKPRLTDKRRVGGSRVRRQQLKGAVPLAMSEEDADEEEEEMDVGGRTSSRRAVDARSSISYMQEDDDFPA